MIKSLVSIVFIFLGGGFAYIFGAVAMTGLNLSIPSNMAVFVLYNGLVCLGVILALKRNVFKKKR